MCELYNAKLRDLLTDDLYTPLSRSGSMSSFSSKKLSSVSTRQRAKGGEKDLGDCSSPEVEEANGSQHGKPLSTAKLNTTRGRRRSSRGNSVGPRGDHKSSNVLNNSTGSAGVGGTEGARAVSTTSTSLLGGLNANTSSSRVTNASSGGVSADLQVKISPRSGQVRIPNATERLVTSKQQLLQILEFGVRLRRTAATRMNHDSSRSHLLLSVYIRDREAPDCTGKITFCDLAGSERIKKSGASGMAMKEAVEINKSLSALGDVLQAVTGGVRGAPIPYRNHKLTQIMQDSLGGSSKTLMFVNVSPCVSAVDETVMSLRFAARTKKVVNNVRSSA
ncbi:unnamed protein product [Amoebophrya sp. A25]|nr:unnamed protein product [Amoebophrya sp. A25]|eukprot:GSA25T00000254001.1